jgi:signal transduction histidine kinase
MITSTFKERSNHGSPVEQAQLMRAVLDSSSSFVHVLQGPTFIVTYANASYFRLVGQRDLIGRPAFEAMPEAAQGGFPERIARVMETGEPFLGRELPVTLARSPGSEPEVRFIDLAYLRLDEGEVGSGCVVGHGTDVTDHVLARRHAQKLTRQTHNRLSDALTAAKMSAWEWDPVTGELSYSDSMPELYRLSPGEARSTPSDWQSALHTDYQKAHANLVRDALQGQGSWHAEFRLRGKEEVWLEERAEVKSDEDSGSRRIVGLVWDISERKRFEMDLRKADERKSSFLSTLAHELRNPLAPIRNGLELLKRVSNLEKVVSIHSMMERQLTHLIRLVDDLMDISRITHGKVALRQERILLGTILSAATETAWPSIAEKDLRLETQVEGVHLVEADRDRLTQVFANLLSNSAKFTPRGGTIRVFAHADRGDAVVSISDTGCGIASELLDDVFEMFSQGPNHHVAGGLGIGLALVRQLVTLHGGSVHARSGGVGKGSEFVVRLPLREPATEIDHPPADFGHDIPPLTQVFEVLVVDDNVDAADSLAEAIRSRGHSVRTAHDGQSALDACKTLLPDIAVLDIGMPDLNGYQVAQRICSEWQGHNRPCLAALTGWGQPEDKQQAQAAGFDFHFTKPVELQELFTKLAL